jgi:Holliday junction DNA helicase RuvB
MMEDLELRAVLEKIIKHEEALLKEFRSDQMLAGSDIQPFWKLFDVPVEWKYVRKLINSEIVKKVRKYYILCDRNGVKKQLASAKTEKRKRKKKVKKSMTKLPKNLFDIIEGFDDIKEFIRMVLSADEPVHVLLAGAPGTAKSLFLMEIERLGAVFITAGSATKVGIRDTLFEELPPILVIDEIEKIESSGDLSSLLTWMENGRVIVTKHGLREERRGKGIVFAACNTTKKLPPELLDRFQYFKIKPYTDEQFVSVVTMYLIKRMRVKKTLAKYIAEGVLQHSVSVREAIRLARLAKTKKDIDKVMKIVGKYR